MTVTIGVVVFPGTNCEHDVVHMVRAAGGEARLVFHTEVDLDGLDGVILPGGFAHGDYLRPGAIARFSPVMGAVTTMARAGRPVLGICNGFQVLTEAGLLPGALQKNAGLKFRCHEATIRVSSTDSIATRLAEPGQDLHIPVNHFEGNYTCDAATLADLEDHHRVVLRYVDNPNGSTADIAGICSSERNVVGLMPHPERAMHTLCGSTDGGVIIRSMLEAASA